MGIRERFFQLSWVKRPHQPLHTIPEDPGPQEVVEETVIPISEDITIIVEKTIPDPDQDQ